MGAEKVESDNCQKTVKNTKEQCKKTSSDITLDECVKLVTQTQSEAEKKMEELLALCANR